MGAHWARTVFETLAYPSPGRSTIWQRGIVRSSVVTANRLSDRVFPGVRLTFASPFRCTRALSKDDLPTFERPTKAISGITPAGSCSAFWQLLINSADRIFTGDL